jgi:hypothetical protein
MPARAEKIEPFAARDERNAMSKPKINEAMYPNLHFWRMQLVAKESLRLAGNLQVMKRELERLRRIRKSLKERRKLMAHDPLQMLLNMRAAILAAHARNPELTAMSRNSNERMEARRLLKESRRMLISVVRTNLVFSD